MKKTAVPASNRSLADTVRRIDTHLAETDRYPRKSLDRSEENRLANAMMTFRARKARGELDESQIAVVETIPGWEWTPKRGRPVLAASAAKLMTILEPLPLAAKPKAKTAKPAATGAKATTQKVKVIPIPARATRFAVTLSKVHAFAVQSGHIPSSGAAVDMSERRLGEWCCTQRANGRADALLPEQVQALETIPGWYWARTSDGEHWHERYTAYSAFVEQYDRHPRRDGAAEDEAQLASWRRTQRAKFANALIPPHTDEQIALLENIDGWAWFDMSGRGWVESFTELSMMFAGGAGHPACNTVLGRWVTKQRAEFASGKLARMRPDFVEMLDSLTGWVWTPDRDDSWLANYVALAEFVRDNDSKMPPCKSSDKEIARLGRWTGVMRRAIVPGKTTMTLTDARIAALELIPGWYWANEGPRLSKVA